MLQSKPTLQTSFALLPQMPFSVISSVLPLDTFDQVVPSQWRMTVASVTASTPTIHASVALVPQTAEKLRSAVVAPNTPDQTAPSQ